MSEPSGTRRRVWGLCMWGSNEWWMTGQKRMRFDTATAAFDFVRTLVKTGVTEGFTTGIRPFYIVSKSKLPDDVKELIRKARKFVGDKDDGNFTGPDGKAFARSLRALDGKY